MLNIDRKELHILIQNAKKEINLKSDYIEKDYWVCFILEYLFNYSKGKDEFCFKGGTCLSKCHKLIYRFSEDIDIVINGHALKIKQEELSCLAGSSSIKHFRKKYETAGKSFIKQEFMPQMKADLKEILPNVEFEISSDDFQSVKFSYPRLFNEDDYIKPYVLIEFGPRALFSPSSLTDISSYVSQIYPSLGHFPVLAYDKELIFIEKVSILYSLCFKSSEHIRKGYSRHLYDLGCFSKQLDKLNTKIFQDLLNKIGVLQVKIFQQKSTNGDNFKIGKLKLVPSEQICNLLKKDYLSMNGMIYDKKPSFNSILKSIKHIENGLNNLKV